MEVRLRSPAKNRDLEADAIEIRLRATRRIDELRQAQKETIRLNRGAAVPTRVRQELSPSGEQIRAGLGEAEVSPAFVHDEPALLDRAIDAGLVFSCRGFQLEQERAVDALDQKTATM